MVLHVNLCLGEKLGSEDGPAVKAAGSDESERDAAAGTVVSVPSLSL